MKNRSLFPIAAIAVLGAFLALGSCKKDGESTPLSISPTSKTVSMDGETFTVNVTSGGTWSYTSTYTGAGGWVKATTQGSNKGNGSVQVVVNANTTATERAMDLVFSDGSGKQTLHIDQAGAPLNFVVSFSPDTTVFGRKTSLSGTVLSNATWTSSTSNDSWISVNPATGNPSTANVTVTITLASNAGAQSRTGSVTFSAGGATRTVDFTQGPAEANSYIIAPNGSYSIPLSQANADGTTRIAETDVVTLKFLWGDTGGYGPGGVVNTMTVDGTGASGSIKVTAGSTPGNAVIAAVVNTYIKWSWHIWVTSFDPVVTGQSYAGTDWASGGQYSGKKIMDRNLGALSAAPSNSLPATNMGLMYQWGRKDPFPAQFQSWADSAEPNLYDGSGGYSNTVMHRYSTATLTSPNNIGYSVTNPTYFFYSTTTPYDWYIGTAGTQDNTLWGNGGDKTVYDPCPPGWKVPGNTAFIDFYTGSAFKNTAATGYQSAWVDFVTSQSSGSGPMSGAGLYYAPTASATPRTSYPVHIPAAGMRSYGSGGFANLASSVNQTTGAPYTTAAVWTSTISTTAGMSRAFLAQGTTLNSTTAMQRAMGLPVRCVQE